MTRATFLAKISFILVVITSLLTFFTNTYLVRNVRSFVESSDESIQSMNMMTQQYENSLKILSIAHEVPLRSELKDSEIRLIQDNQARLSVITTDFINAVNTLNQISLNRHIQRLELSTLLAEDIQSFNQYFLVFNDTTVDETIQYNTLTTILPLLRNSLDELSLNQSSVTNEMIRDLELLINVLIVLLLLQISVALVFLFFTLRQAPMLTKRLRNLAYPTTKVDEPKINPWISELKDVYGYIDVLEEDRRYIVELREVLAHLYLVDDVMDALFTFLNKRLDVYRLGIAFVDYEKSSIIAEYGAIQKGYIRLGPGFSVPIEQTSLKNIIENKRVVVNHDIESNLKENPNSPSLNLIFEEGIKSNMILPLKTGDLVFGFLFVSSDKKAYFTERHTEWLEEVAEEISVILDRSFFTKVIFQRIVLNFATLVDQKDRDTGDHLTRMVYYSTLIAQGLMKLNHPDYQVTPRYILEIERSAATHDIGKVAVPDSILKKAGPLTDEEWEIMRKHPVQGAQIFQDFREGLRNFDSSLFEVAEDIALYHHEKFDGTGYPKGLKGFKIPLAARIIAVADVFDALSSQRIYKKAFSLDDSFDELRNIAGKHLDPILVQVFLTYEHEIREKLDREFI